MLSGLLVVVLLLIYYQILMLFIIFGLSLYLGRLVLFIPGLLCITFQCSTWLLKIMCYSFQRLHISLVTWWTWNAIAFNFTLNVSRNCWMSNGIRSRAFFFFLATMIFFIWNLGYIRLKRNREGHLIASEKPLKTDLRDKKRKIWLSYSL